MKIFSTADDTALTGNEIKIKEKHFQIRDQINKRNEKIFKEETKVLWKTFKEKNLSKRGNYKNILENVKKNKKNYYQNQLLKCKRGFRVS